MSLNKISKRRNFIISIVFYAIVLVLAFLFLEYALKWIMPFLIGYIVALAFNPLIKLIVSKSKIPRKVCAFGVVVVGYVLFGILLWNIGGVLFREIKEFCLNIPSMYTNEISPFLSSANEGILNFAKRFSPEAAEQIGEILENMLDGVQSSLVDLSASILSGFAGISKKVPLYLISFIFTILSSLFISMDFDKVKAFLFRQIPEKNQAMILDIKDYLGKTIASYLKAYLILMCITFIEVSVGLSALQVKNALGIGAIIAVADAFPILGTGTIVLPWAVISIFQERYYLALGLVLLYLIVTAVRQFIEPKIVGDQLGIPPIVAIICIYLGFVWFGVKGVILFPVTMNVIVCLHRAGKIHIWK